MTTEPEPAADPHPLATFLSNYQAARTLLLTEQFRQQAIGANGPDEATRAQARADAASIASDIAVMDQDKSDFLVGVVSATLPPSQELVDATVQLNQTLAQVTIDANTPGTYLRIMTGFLNGISAVASGRVPATSAAGGGGAGA